MKINGKFVIGTHKIGHLISSIRSSKGLSQEEFAKEIGISRSYLGDLENSRKSISLDIFIKLMEKTGYTVFIEENEVQDE